MDKSLLHRRLFFSRKHGDIVSRKSLWMIGLFFCCVIVALAYTLGLNGPFLLDDFHVLTRLALPGGVGFDNIARYVFGGGGNEYFRSVSMLSFLVDDQSWPTSPYNFKRTNVAIHLVNALLMFFLVRKLLAVIFEDGDALRLAFICTMLWVFHPLHVSSVLYVVQRMTILMHMFLMCSLIFYVYFRLVESNYLKALFLTIAGIFSFFSFFSKENGCVVLLLYLLLDFFFLVRSRRWVDYIIPLSLGLIFVVAFFVQVLFSLDDYSARDYSIFDRVITQGKVLFSYIIYFVNPFSDQFTLFHDSEELKLKNYGLGGVWPYWLFHVFAVIIVFLFFKKKKLVLFGVLWFYVSHIVESTFLPLELKFEHRNYLPSVGLCLIISSFLNDFYFLLREKKLEFFAGAFFVLLGAILFVSLLKNTALWGDNRMMLMKWAQEHPDSLRSQASLVGMYQNDGLYGMAYDHLNITLDRFDDLGLRLNGIELACILGVDHFENQKLVFPLSQVENISFGSTVTINLARLLQLKDKKCVEQYIVGGGLSELVIAIGNMKLLRSKSRYYAQYLDVAASYFISERDYRNALFFREKLWVEQPTVDTALKLVDIYILGGDLSNASHYMFLAEKKYADQYFKDSETEKNINTLRLYLKFLENDNSR